ncbi:hypothetical protein SBRCBS47491_006912 [Sporothrix bragantina]|uniref:Peptidase A1 domain-containing protein n=1 Tax=Sporothrix bragantina TaxID=671064 RepID=A0ABP0CBE4_9PEZI
MAPGAKSEFDRDDVKKAIHAPPNVTWTLCTTEDVFVGGRMNDTSLPDSFHAIPQVIDATQNVIIGYGALDYILLANGTLLTIQNMTWGGQMGFQSPPIEPI